MILYVPVSLAKIKRVAHPRLGRLLLPSTRGTAKATSDAGIQWAIDNGAYRGFEAQQFLHLVASSMQVPGGTFVAAPDYVGDAWGTARRFAIWGPLLKECGLPVAYVLQDGLDVNRLPWDGFDAVFVGGSTEFKLGKVARTAVEQAKDRGLWVHMGRVNAWIDGNQNLAAERIDYAYAIGCDSIDGSAFARFFDTLTPKALARIDQLEGQPFRGSRILEEALWLESVRQ